MRNEVMWAIRDAAGLNQYEKSLLWAIESCGTAKRTRENMAALAGMKKDTFYNTRKSLVNKGLILVCRKHNNVSWYTVVEEAVLALPQLSDMQNETDELSVSQKELSVSQKEDSLRPETKKNIKKNKKKNVSTKKNTRAGALGNPSLPKEDVPQAILNQSPSFEEIVTPLLDDATFSLKQTAHAPSDSKAQERERERQLAETRREQVLRDMGIDPAKEWPE